MSSSKRTEEQYKDSDVGKCAVIAYNYLKELREGELSEKQSNMMNLAEEIIIMRQQLIPIDEIGNEEMEIVIEIIGNKKNIDKAYDLGTHIEGLRQNSVKVAETEIINKTGWEDKKGVIGCREVLNDPKIPIKHNIKGQCAVFLHKNGEEDEKKLAVDIMEQRYDNANDKKKDLYSYEREEVERIRAQEAAEAKAAEAKAAEAKERQERLGENEQAAKKLRKKKLDEALDDFWDTLTVAERQGQRQGQRPKKAPIDDFRLGTSSTMSPGSWPSEG